MSPLLYTVIGVVVVVVLAVLAAGVVTRRRRSSRLRRTFGREYERVIQATGDRTAAEQELTGRVHRREQLRIAAVTELNRRLYLEQWQRVQADFIDAPAQCVRRADVLVSQVMTDHGYPMAEFEQRAADISVDHADVVENYRRAHAGCIASGRDGATTEDLRQAMTNYRSLFEKLLDAGSLRGALSPTQTAAADRPIGEPSPIDVGDQRFAPSVVHDDQVDSIEA